MFVFSKILDIIVKEPPSMAVIQTCCYSDLSNCSDFLKMIPVSDLLVDVYW